MIANLLVALLCGLQTLSTPMDADLPGRTADNPLPFGRGLEYPERALQRGVMGVATIRCTSDPQGVPVDCVLIDETPKDVGFGRAALAAARYQTIPADSPLREGPVYFTARFALR